MLRKVASRAMWVGRTAAAVFGLALVLALVVGVATMALAAAPGDPFRLGQTNGIDAISTLVGNAAGPMLRVDNNSTSAAATALDLQVEAGKPPMKVNSATKVANLNADRLDGRDSTGFLGKTQKAADADKLDGKDSSKFISNSTRLYVLFFSPPQGEPNKEHSFLPGCDGGDVVLAGGYADVDAGTQIIRNGPHPFMFSTPSWIVTWKNDNTVDAITLMVSCVDFPPAHTS